MEKEQARQLLPFVNNPEFDYFMSLFIKLESDMLYKNICTITDDVTLRQTQGKLQQIERLRTIRERIIEAAK